ncbi:MAG: LuxR C-terminal-related transcriptional regulator [Cytophagaceae bacterium]|nr:LuxR C-terminal-related transcriptional regulator [Cytophagaceae bacterium]
MTVKSNPLLENVLSVGPCFVYMLDYRTMKYIYLSSSFKNILGYDVPEIMEGGPKSLFAHLHPEDSMELMHHTFKKIMDFYHGTPPEERKKIRCSYDYRLKRSDGKYVRLLQQTLVIDMDSEGKPLIDIGIASDITEYKKENKITLSLSKYDQEMGFVTLNQEFGSGVQKDRISERELQILQLLMKGYSSKKIADQLHISVNTVRNHRQNLLEKTKTKNIAELITFALSNSLI